MYLSCLSNVSLFNGKLIELLACLASHRLPATKRIKYRLWEHIICSAHNSRCFVLLKDKVITLYAVRALKTMSTE